MLVLLRDKHGNEVERVVHLEFEHAEVLVFTGRVAEPARCFRLHNRPSGVIPCYIEVPGEVLSARELIQ